MLRIFTTVKIQRLRPGLNPQTWVPEASTLTTRPPKPPALDVGSHQKWELKPFQDICFYHPHVFKDFHFFKWFFVIFRIRQYDSWKFYVVFWGVISLPIVNWSGLVLSYADSVWCEVGCVYYHLLGMCLITCFLILLVFVLSCLASLC